MVKLRNILIVIGIIFVLVFGAMQFTKMNPSIVPVLSTPPPTAVPEVQIEDKFSEVISPDGKHMLTMKTQEKDGQKNYTFYLETTESSIKESLFESGWGQAEYGVPFNAFSPDTRFVFLSKLDGVETQYLVLPINKVQDKEVAPTNINELFYGKYDEFKITDATGWGGIGLVVVNTDRTDGERGPSFWFEAATGRFIKLSARFN